MSGATANMAALAITVAVLAPGRSPAADRYFETVCLEVLKEELAKVRK